MAIRIEEADNTCWVDSPEGIEHVRVEDVTVVTDAATRMSMASINGMKIAITEDEADRLTVAGAVDGRKHLNATSSDSPI
ncbi:Protein of unknown function [Pseudomonas taetrolens]|uniref:DUF3203 domain-containing protein n=1 Tax=Pseudomonas taetrolens TaxID=47884 RepID=A0A0J6JGP1_PSETA|nr:DUF3203 family protein [Pseudomonas taetrolens]KMM82942.1 hypothetical protein TU78_20035 [Pseudomonas taetrolens]SEC12952.1 Protein of unknown function [Pseudomonas taetrolens]SQF86008.1 Protein of uncharacterised function (DUF3203) [Pseudomonas taetrolens]VEH49085.1 Protein of uncharacterised function (DUF3203) [Pseudomonas taetrolens]